MLDLSGITVHANVMQSEGVVILIFEVYKHETNSDLGTWLTLKNSDRQSTELYDILDWVAKCEQCDIFSMYNN